MVLVTVVPVTVHTTSQMQQDNDVCRSGGCLFPSLKVENTAYSVPTIHSFDSCMHFIIALVPIPNLSKEQHQFQFSNSEVSLPLPQYM